MRRRTSPVRPSLDKPMQNLYPVEKEPGAQQDDKQEEKEDVEQGCKGKELEDIVGKYEDLRTKVEQYFDDANHGNPTKVLVVRTPVKPTRNEWLQHQATHIPFAPWCKHCVAARAVRHAYPSKGRRALVIKDIAETDDQMI